MDQELTAEVAGRLVQHTREASTAADRAMVRAAIAHGMTYEIWRRNYLRNLPQKVAAAFAKLEAADCDIEACLRAMYEEVRRGAVN